MDRICELLENQFLTVEEVKELQENKNVEIKLNVRSFAYHDYNWLLIKIDDNLYNIYYR